MRRLTSVSSVLCKSGFLVVVGELLRPNMDRPVLGVMRPPLRCRPAFSRSSSFQERIVASNDSISNRFESARGVVRNDKRTFVTSLRSTLVSDEERRSLRSASIRCSFRMTPTRGQDAIRKDTVRWTWQHVPSWRSFPMRRFFSLTSFSSSWVLDELFEESSMAS